MPGLTAVLDGDTWLGRWNFIEPWRRGHQGGLVVCGFLELRCQASAIFCQRTDVPVDISSGTAFATGKADLLDNLISLPGIHLGGVVANPEVPAFFVFTRPPFQELGIALSGRFYAPVQLWRTVIQPSVV